MAKLYTFLFPSWLREVTNKSSPNLGYINSPYHYFLAELVVVYINMPELYSKERINLSEKVNGLFIIVNNANSLI